MKLVALNAKDKKVILTRLKDDFGFDTKLDYHLFRHTTDDKLYLMSTAVNEIDLSKLNVNSLGLYFAAYHADSGEIRLSIEGSQVIGPHATKGVIRLPKDIFDRWMMGQDIPTDETESKYVLIQNEKGDYFGTGRIKEGEILNFVPKARRIKNIAE
ncbi:MAG: NOL1/NOP2/fmu family ribosome biogenesis protein [Candidatus Woesearchaeota archaeon]|jgi:NOL1/NOP2/fmu family ribosome biogenesis protein